MELSSIVGLLVFGSIGSIVVEAQPDKVVRSIDYELEPGMVVHSIVVEPDMVVRSIGCELEPDCGARRCHRWGNWGICWDQLLLGIWPPVAVLMHKPRLSIKSPCKAKEIT